MKIAEIFTSIQGEGLTSGYPTVFVRLAGCNLRCTYCDTQYAQDCSGAEMTPVQVASEVLRTGVIHVCITGGEPLLQQEELLVLLPMLRDNGLEITIETNGTVGFQQVLEYATVCMDVKCPSSGETSDLSLLSAIRREDSVKYVVGTREDLVYASRVMESSPVEGTIFWSPVSGCDYTQVISYIMEHRLPVRFQVQLHKILGVQ
jgi:7-carboxy-7-deazaguanine synthase